ncbi:hypothetical protein PISL3812_03324 [Talaromyces islandicus]|uniref:Uncharacterized protein n=1 Tax=Talaromyces islandicus TaxID=28573 RepID=A0A0U1LSF5_TALIS|nr:hypothetical protein PISL3812_03324 [Talaromyces islandicus]
MVTLNLTIDETDPTLKEVHGRYSDWKAFGILTRYLEPGSDLSDEQATELLYDILPSPDNKKLSGQPDMLGCVLLDIAKQIPYHHPSQIRLLNLFKRLGKTDKMTLHFSHEEYKYSYYNTMHFLKITLREWFPWSDEVNFCAFVARLSTTEILNYFDGLNYAIWTMRDNLEEEHNDGEYSNDAISSSAMWIICAGQWLFNELVQFPRNINDEYYESAWKVGPLYQGPIIGLERWKFWQKAFTVAAESSNANDECKKNALKAANLMEVIARDCKW